jgi:hypothetical protein
MKEKQKLLQFRDMIFKGYVTSDSSKVNTTANQKINQTTAKSNVGNFNS